MSGHDNFDFGQDQQLNPPSPYQTWDEYFDLTNGDAGMISGSMEINAENNNSIAPNAENNNGIPPNAPVQEGPTFDGTTLNGPGSVNHDAVTSQFTDQPMFASPSAQTFGAEPMSTTPLVSANQTTALPAQVFYGSAVSSFDPANQGVNPHHVMGPNNNPTWSPTGADLYQQYQPLTTQRGYPVPHQQQQWSGMEHTQFQQAGQALAGAYAVDSHSYVQPNTAENHFFAHQPQDGSTNASHGFSHPAVAPAWRTLAPRPAFDAQATAPMIQDSSDNAKPVPPAAAPVKKEAKVKQTARRNRPTTSKAKVTTTRMPLYNSQLPVLSLEDAKKAVEIKRFELKVIDDDWEDVAAQKADFVGNIVKALEVGYRPQAEEHDRLTAEGQAEFTRWQTEHENKAWTVLDDEEVEDPQEFAQACAVILFHRILEAHKSRFLADPGKSVANGSVDITTKCSARLNAAIAAIGEYSIVKYDFLRQERLEGLIASPKGFWARKQENCFVNYKKKETSGPVKLEADKVDSAAAPKANGKGKRKRKEPSPPPSGDEDDEVDGASDDEFEQRTKRTKRR